LARRERHADDGALDAHPMGLTSGSEVGPE
jgi:hypothetical protein